LGVFYDPSAAAVVSGGGVSGEGVAAVPEPGSGAILLTGLIGVLMAAALRRKTR
jgi:hypothetical protein